MEDADAPPSVCLLHRIPLSSSCAFEKSHNIIIKDGLNGLVLREILVDFGLWFHRPTGLPRVALDSLTKDADV